MANDPYNLRTLDHFGSNKYQWKVKNDILDIRSFARPGEINFTPEKYNYDLAGTIAHTLVCDLLRMQEVVNVNINIDPGHNPFFGTHYEALPFALANIALTLGHHVLFGGNPRTYSDDVDIEHGVYVSHFRNFCNFIPEEVIEKAGYWEFDDVNGTGGDRAICIAKMVQILREYTPGYSESFETLMERAKTGYVSGGCPFVLHPFDHLPVRDLSMESPEGLALYSVKEWFDAGRRIRCDAQPVYMHPTLDEPCILDYYDKDSTEVILMPEKKEEEDKKAAPKVARREDAYTVQVGMFCSTLQCKAGDARCLSCSMFAGHTALDSLIYCKNKL